MPSSMARWDLAASWSRRPSNISATFPREANAARYSSTTSVSLGAWKTSAWATAFLPVLPLAPLPRSADGSAPSPPPPTDLPAILPQPPAMPPAASCAAAASSALRTAPLFVPCVLSEKIRASYLIRRSSRPQYAHRCLEVPSSPLHFPQVETSWMKALDSCWHSDSSLAISATHVRLASRIARSSSPSRYLRPPTSVNLCTIEEEFLPAEPAPAAYRSPSIDLTCPTKLARPPSSPSSICVRTWTHQFPPKTSRSDPHETLSRFAENSAPASTKLLDAAPTYFCFSSLASSAKVESRRVGATPSTPRLSSSERLCRVWSLCSESVLIPMWRWSLETLRASLYASTAPLSFPSSWKTDPRPLRQKMTTLRVSSASTLAFSIIMSRISSMDRRLWLSDLMPCDPTCGWQQACLRRSSLAKILAAALGPKGRSGSDSPAAPVIAPRGNAATAAS
mmetsp:Transcript_5756/g.20668  ORF Transcript_5756/g.20668 Transcript_5756/m.20668 type:complete len:452 (-) Transcript_5756:2173-3528(-)